MAPHVDERVARAEELAPLRAALRAWLGGTALGARRGEDLVMAVQEAAANCVRHAYEERPRGTMTVRGRVEPSGDVVVTVRDGGLWRVGEEGHGTRVMRAVCHEMTVESGRHGTLVTLRQEADPGGR